MDPYLLLRSVLFKLDPELAHNLTLAMAERAPFFGHMWPTPWKDDERFVLNIAGLAWRFPIGLAAGLDKDARCLDFFERLGFGSMEVGTVTPLPQPGNPRPRLWRYPSDQSLRNAFGFNNEGMQMMARQLGKWPKHSAFPVGVNLGKNKLTSDAQTPEDYLQGYTHLSQYSDYVVINVSSPNTPGLRDMQSVDKMREILRALVQMRKQNLRPLFIKISPDLNRDEVQSLADLAKEFKLSGLIATNTTIRPDLGPGGVSGKWLREKAAQVRAWALESLAETKDLTVIGVGGVSKYEDLTAFWKMGGHLMQVYSSFIFQGPALLKKIFIGIENDLLKYRCANISGLIEIYQSEKD